MFLISRTDEGQPRPKYIFNKCGTYIYFFTLQRFGPSPSLNLKYFSLCWAISVFVGLFQSLLGYFSFGWAISVFVGLFQSLLGYFSLCWAISVFVGQFQSLLGYFRLCWAISVFVSLFRSISVFLIVQIFIIDFNCAI